MQVYLSALVFFWIAAKQLEEIVACENVRFQESEQKYLPNHVMKTKQADSDLVCGLYCIADKSCTSVNYKTSGVGKGRCELNNKTTEETSDVDDKIDHPEFNHLVVIERPIPSSKPRSCSDHLKNGSKTNGYYNIYDTSSNLVTVYCDVTSERGKVWTLVMSWATRNKDMAEFQSTPFSKDSPVEKDLSNWNKYRMSLRMMNDLRAQSTHWRATCSFSTYGVDYVDYVRGKFVDFDVVNFLGDNVCKRVEYVNIRGHQCSDCYVPWWQIVNINFLHTDSEAKTCGFNPSQGAVHTEDNFGYYGTVNSNFRCTADSNATTNWWFGGNIPEF